MRLGTRRTEARRRPSLNCSPCGSTHYWRIHRAGLLNAVVLIPQIAREYVPSRLPGRECVGFAAIDDSRHSDCAKTLGERSSIGERVM